jgi:SPP1 family predicted phage head-tail adaptor
MFDNELKLISRTPTTMRDSRGQVIYTEKSETALCEVVPIARDEFFNGAQVGLNPEYEFKINPIEYSGQKILEFEGRRFSIYRTYQPAPDTLELYAEYTVGLNGGEDDDS